MENWIEAIKECYNINEYDTKDEIYLSILDNGANGAKILFNDNNLIALTWKNRNNDYIIAAGKVEPAEDLVLQDKLSYIISVVADDKNVNLYAAREVIIDDLRGIEVCCGIEFSDKESIFYALYLSDSNEGYLITGFGNEKPEISFDELCGAARTFYRGQEPSVYFKGKESNDLFESIRHIAKITRPKKGIDWDIANITFSVDDGKILNNPSVIIISKNNISPYNSNDAIESSNLHSVLSSLSIYLTNIYDITGFTITNFYDGRYGITFYPISDEEEHNHSDDCDCGCHNHSDTLDDETNVDMYDNIVSLDKVLEKVLPNNHKNIMFLIPIKDDYYTIYLYSSLAGSLKQIVVDEEVFNIIAEEIESLLDKINNISEQYTIILCYNRDNINEYKLDMYSFDKFIDADEVDNSYHEYFNKLTNLFFNELNNFNEAINLITFKLFIKKNMIFSVEEAIAVSNDNITPINYSENNLIEIYDYFEKLNKGDELDGYVKVVVFPNKKIGFSSEENYEDYGVYGLYEYQVTRENFKDKIIDINLMKYYNNLTPLIKDEVICTNFLIDNEVSLPVGVSKFGGSPDLSEDINFPLNKKNKLMKFLAQINLDEINSIGCDLTLLPKTGLLSFFYDEISNECKVIHINKKDLVRYDINLHDNDYYLPARIKFINAVSFPYITENNINDFNFFENDSDMETYEEVFTAFDKCKICGYPDIITEEIKTPLDKKAILLLQISSTNATNIKWDNYGMLYFFIYEEDLKLLDFSKCWTVFQSE